MMRPFMALLWLWLAVPGESFIAVDVSNLVKPSSASCFKQSVNAVIVRLLRSTGQIDTAGVSSLENLLKISMPAAVYAYPNVQGNAIAQASAVAATLKRFQSAYSLAVAIDVEGTWMRNVTQNCAFLLSFVQTLRNSSLRVLIYSNWSNWANIFGSTQSCNISKYVPYVWYAHYDGLKTFSDFQPFAGWTSPFLKQYNQNVNLCGMTVDMNWSSD